MCWCEEGGRGNREMEGIKFGNKPFHLLEQQYEWAKFANNDDFHVVKWNETIFSNDFIVSVSILMAFKYLR